jgi:hypothetical protein
MEKRPLTALSLVSDLGTDSGVYFILFGILHLTVRQHEIPLFWGWVFIALGALLLGLVIFLVIRVVKIVKKAEGTLTETKKVDLGLKIHVDLILGLLLITYFAPLIGPDAGFTTWLAFVSGILIAAGRIVRYLGKFIAYRVKGKAEEIKKKYESEEKDGEE